MIDKRKKQNRKSIRLKNYDYSNAGYYFVTIVTHKRANLFGSVEDGTVELNSGGKLVEELWTEIPLHFPYVTIDQYIIMPNHLHGILIINDNVGARHASPLPPDNLSQHKQQPLGTIIGSFKSAVTKRIHDLGSLDQEKIWQRNYYEHIIRDERDYEKIYEYIQFNPMNWSLDEENLERSR